ncbi:hypothetical protein LTR09_011723 [Extremus antarcticus]|uniref:Uncharacterized protein n=1 Tax=Extremus antarcticus TaxID=702011 RepID=A0AAJ0G7M9_9PEZI|nr:hypothetical protein LTR09_011723 [Extremus antarcticus]
MEINVLEGTTPTSDNKETQEQQRRPIESRQEKLQRFREGIAFLKEQARKERFFYETDTSSLPHAQVLEQRDKEGRPVKEINVLERMTLEEQLEEIEDELNDLYVERRELQEDVDNIRPEWRQLRAWQGGHQARARLGQLTEILQRLYDQAQQQQNQLNQLLDQQE